MPRRKSSNPFLHAIQINAKRRVKRFDEFKAAGASWMIECRDLWDSEDEDAGVYFVDCATKHDVNAFIKRMDPSSDRILGIYDLSKPLANQVLGLTLEQWMAR